MRGAIAAQPKPNVRDIWTLPSLVPRGAGLRLLLAPKQDQEGTNND